MRQITILALIASLAGCASADYCGMRAHPEWKPLTIVPREGPRLIKALPIETGFRMRYEDMSQHWFKRADGALLVCRQDFELQDTSDRCDSDGWIFEGPAGRRQTHREWESMCIE